MSNEEANQILKELYEVRPEKLNDKAKRLFEAIMKIADERDSVKADLYEANNRINDLLDLVKQKDKEIEHQKEKRENQKQELAILNAKQIEFNKLKNTVNSYKGQFKRQQKEIEELKQIKCKLDEKNIPIETLLAEFERLEDLEDDLTTVYLNGVYDGEKKVKDKIKAEIEELKEDIKYSANPLSIDNSKFGIKVLQSLLEKE